MYLVLIAWFYVALMMAVAEAVSPIGTVLGAVFTLLLYGLLPMLVVGYIMGTPARRRARQAQELQAAQALNTTPASNAAPNASGEAPRDAVAAERKEA